MYPNNSSMLHTQIPMFLRKLSVISLIRALSEFTGYRHSQKREKKSITVEKVEIRE